VFLAQHGVRPVAQAPCDSDAPVTMREFLSRIQSGECSYTWKLPPSLHAGCVIALLEWRRPGSTSTARLQAAPPGRSSCYPSKVILDSNAPRRD
jgi:hypothetical protein